ncbi:MAG TPA: hypothetical protein VL404_09675 [Candidatus Eisenbacteria bacterium]|nr:hypothetical protein [Candidatus Eisenbacteria bacterium]
MTRRIQAAALLFSNLLLFTAPLYAASPLETTSHPGGARTASQQEEAFLRNLRLIQQKNQQMLLEGQQDAEKGRKASAPQLFTQDAQLRPPASAADVALEAGYVVSSQFLSAGDPANGAINNVYGAPTWIVPRENALAIINLIQSAEITQDASYLAKAELAASYLVRVQDQTDGGWYDQYDHATPVSFSKSPTQTAEVMIGLDKLGYDSSRYAAMKKGAQFLMACQDPANKGGFDDGLLGGGKDSNGNFMSWRWASDNSFAYVALKAAKMWAVVYGDADFASQAESAASRVLNGINTSLYNGDPADDDYGVWKRAIDRFGAEQEPWFHEWINYAPQMLDLPALGVGNARVGEWIHTQLQKSDGAVVWVEDSDANHFDSREDRKSPGFSFQAALVWYDLGQTAYADAAVNWAKTSGLWQTTPDQNGIKGGWIDWTEPNDQAPFWQRFIDTSFYAVTAFSGGYDFRVRERSTDILRMKLQDNDGWRNDFNLLWGTHIGTDGNVSTADDAALDALTHDPNYRFETFYDALPKAANLLRDLRGVSGRLADFNLLYGTSLAASGSPNAADRLKLFQVVLQPTYVPATYQQVLTKAASLYRSLQSSTAARTDFNLLFGAALVNTGAPTAVDLGKLFDTAGSPTYVQSTFLSVLTKAASLYRNLQSNAANRADFNLLFGTTAAATGSPDVVTRTALFDTTGSPSYANQSTFLSVLTKAAALYRNLQASASNRADFNLLFGTTVQATGSPSVVSRTALFDTAGSPSYTQASFLTGLAKSASLYRALQANNAKRLSFNTRYKAQLPVSGSPVVKDRTLLFNITGDPNYNQTKFLNSL